MSKGPVKVSAEEAAKNQAFLASMAASGKERYIKRHSLQARLTHGITIAACILLCISTLLCCLRHQLYAECLCSPRKNRDKNRNDSKKNRSTYKSCFNISQWLISDIQTKEILHM